MNIYLFRHGQTEWNKLHRFQGRFDIPLNDYGRELARVTARNWPIVPYDRVYCSPLCRAQETAQLVLAGREEAQHIITDARVIEFAFGENDGKNIDIAGNDPANAMYNLLHHPEEYVPAPGAESFQQLIDRAAAFLRDEILPLEAQGVQHVLIVAHGALNRAMVCAAGFKTVRDFWAVPYHNCCLTTLSVTDGVFSLVREAEVFYDASNAFGGWVNR